MLAWQLDKLSGIDSIALRDVPAPAPAPDEVLLAVRYAALNPADAYLAEGQYPARPPLPHVLGRDGLGTVTAVGTDVRDWNVGDTALILRGDVGVTRWGTLAQRVTVPADSLVRPPTGWTFEQASGAPLVYMTAYQALTQFDTPPGKATADAGPTRIVLITGASGGVGSASVQLAKAFGHTVIALSRSEAKRATLAELGADLSLDPNDTQWRRRAREFCESIHTDRRVDLAIDNIGGSLFPELLDTLGMDGLVSVVGRLAGPVPSFNTASLFFRRITIRGVAVGTYTREQTQQVWTRVVELLARTGARPPVDSVHPFDNVPGAFATLSKGPMGKVLIDVQGAAS